MIDSARSSRCSTVNLKLHGVSWIRLITRTGLSESTRVLQGTSAATDEIAADTNSTEKKNEVKAEVLDEDIIMVVVLVLMLLLRLL